MRILVLAESLNYNRTSEGGCTSKFLLGLHQEGCEVICLHADNTLKDFPWLDKIQLISIINNPWSIYNVFATLSKRVPLLDRALKRLTGFSAKFWHEVRLYKKQIQKHLKTEVPYDLVVVRSAGSSFRTHFAMLGVKYSGKWIAHFHDPFPFSQYPKPYKNYPLGFEKQEKKVKELIRNSSYVSVASNLLKEWITAFSGRQEGVFVMPHTALRLFKEVNKKENSQCVFLHSGALLGERNPIALLNAFEMLLETNADFKSKVLLKFQGNVNSQQIMDALETFKRSYPDSISYTEKRVSYEESIMELQRADYSIVLEAEEVYSPFLPGKFVDALAYKKLVIAITPKQSEIRTVLGLDYPFVADSQQEYEIEKVLLKAYSSWKQNEDSKIEMGKFAKGYSPFAIRKELELRIREKQKG